MNESILQSIAKSDRDIPLPVMDVVNRVPIGNANYGDVWEDVDLEVKFNPNVCKKCTSCRPELVCPTCAISFKDDLPILDRTRCFNCGLCASVCAGETFSADLGALRFGGRDVPIVVRQSDRLRAQRLAERLKNRVLDGSFKMTRMAEPIYPHP